MTNLDRWKPLAQNVMSELALALLLCGCGGTHKPVETRMVRVNGGTREVAMPVIGGPPVWHEGRWQCGGHYRYNYLSTRCELE